MRKYNGLTIIHGVLAAALLTACASRAPEHSDAPGSPAPQATPSNAPEPVVTPPPQQSAPVALREDAPLRYVVKKGDTLWGIANHFIKQPWQWPEIWYVNDQVRNPHLIFPGDVLTLVWRDGRPMVMAADGISANTEYLSPRVRELPLDQAIPTIPLESIRDFLSNPRLVDAEELRDAPYILSFVDPHVIEGAGSLVYVQKMPNGGRTRWDAIRLGSKMVDPDSGELLGWEGTPVGAVEVRAFGAPATATITRSDREAIAGDRLIPPADETLDTNFYPHAPKHKIGGRILSVYDGVSQIGQYQVVTLNRGKREGMEPGHVLSILQAGRRARDPYTSRLVTLPDLYAGTLMVFKVESKVSYALVMSATREIHTLDRVEQPQDGERL